MASEHARDAAIEQRHRNACADLWLRIGRVTGRDADNIRAGEWDETEDLKWFVANMPFAPSDDGCTGAEYKPGDLVEKHEGYPFGKGDAVVLAAYRCASGTGPWRYVVEHPEGWQHIFSGKQLRRAPEQGREDGE